MSGRVFPFCGWWLPDRWARVLWAAEGVVLPERVPVWVCGRAPGGGGPRSWLVLGPKARAVLPSRSVSGACVGDGPRSFVAWSASWLALCAPALAGEQASWFARCFAGEEV